MIYTYNIYIKKKNITNKYACVDIIVVLVILYTNV